VLHIRQQVTKENRKKNKIPCGEIPSPKPRNPSLGFKFGTKLKEDTNPILGDKKTRILFNIT